VPADPRAQQHRAKGRGVGRPSERQRRPRKRFAVVADQADWMSKLRSITQWPQSKSVRASRIYVAIVMIDLTDGNCNDMSM